MRNGNLFQEVLYGTRPSSFLPYLWGMETFIYSKTLLDFGTQVLTVPMRNGNFVLIALIKRRLKFLPYLWGMETMIFLSGIWSLTFGSYRTYEEWKHPYCLCITACCPVLTVPMRNGNRWKWNVSSKILLVLTVPMRNGNLYRFQCSLNIAQSSYRTYEEWKPHGKIPDTEVTRPFLPYLWGMETPQRRHPLPGCSHRVLTVPMRNGNYWGWTKILSIFWFLPYLWGMETDVSKKICPQSMSGSYRTYEEWKPNSLSLLPLYTPLVLTVPMRNGNSPSGSISPNFSK